MAFKKEENFAKWFQDLIKNTELVDDRYNIKGFIVYREWSAISLKKMFRVYEDILDNLGHYPLYMPVLIPEANFFKESKHVEGFTPEVYWVTEHGNGEKLEEKLALRPTSETAFYQMYNLWIRSYNDLPFKRYQSGPVYRYETKATRPFFRGREFHWIETHCVLKNKEEAEKQIKEDLNITTKILKDRFGLNFLFFKRPEWDKFAGAEDTYGADVFMPSGKFLQVSTTHYLGTNFAKAFDLKYTNEDKQDVFGHQTTFGIGMTRIYGALIASFSDNKGLRLPFELSPVQIVIVPILFANKDNKEVLKKVEEVKELFKNNYKVILDLDADKTPGEKYYYWEMKGVPIRIEIGPKDIEKKSAVIVRRDLNKKEFIDFNDLESQVKNIEKEYTKNLFKEHENFQEASIVDAKELKELKNILKKDKIARINFCSIDSDGEECADKIKKYTGGEVRGIRLDKEEKANGKCIICGKPAKHIVYVGKSY